MVLGTAQITVQSFTIQRHFAAKISQNVQKVVDNGPRWPEKYQEWPNGSKMADHAKNCAKWTQNCEEGPQYNGQKKNWSKISRMCK